MGSSNYYDALCVVGMNRIRHAYMQITPEVEPYLVMGTHNNEASVELSMGTPPASNLVVDIIVSTPFVVAVINSVIGGVIATLVARQLGLATPVVIVSAIAAVALVLGGRRCSPRAASPQRSPPTSPSSPRRLDLMAADSDAGPLAGVRAGARNGHSLAETCTRR